MVRACALSEAAHTPAQACALPASQCEAWRPLRLPAVLVGDGRLGGISTTLAAADSLRLRGYDLAAVAVSTRLHWS